MKPKYYVTCKKCGCDVHQTALEQGLNGVRMNALKYVMRAGKKDPSKLIEDLIKAKQSIEDEITYLQGYKDEAVSVTIKSPVNTMRNLYDHSDGSVDL